MGYIIEKINLYYLASKSRYAFSDSSGKILKEFNGKNKPLNSAWIWERKLIIKNNTIIGKIFYSHIGLLDILELFTLYPKVKVA